MSLEMNSKIDSTAIDLTVHENRALSKSPVKAQTILNFLKSNSQIEKQDLIEKCSIRGSQQKKLVEEAFSQSEMSNVIGKLITLFKLEKVGTPDELNEIRAKFSERIERNNLSLIFLIMKPYWIFIVQSGIFESVGSI